MLQMYLQRASSTRYKSVTAMSERSLSILLLQVRSRIISHNDLPNVDGILYDSAGLRAFY